MRLCCCVWPFELECESVKYKPILEFNQFEGKEK